MKLKEEYNLSILKNYGFTRITPEDIENDDDYVLSNFEYQYNIGYGRRGQFYYIFVSEHKVFQLWSSPPDGSGTFVEFPNVVFEMINDNILEI